jgi:hypothetical protein
MSPTPTRRHWIGYNHVCRMVFHSAFTSVGTKRRLHEPHWNVSARASRVARRCLVPSSCFRCSALVALVGTANDPRITTTPHRATEVQSLIKPPTQRTMPTASNIPWIIAPLVISVRHDRRGSIFRCLGLLYTVGRAQSRGQDGVVQTVQALRFRCYWRLSPGGSRLP